MSPFIKISIWTSKKMRRKMTTTFGTVTLVVDEIIEKDDTGSDYLIPNILTLELIPAIPQNRPWVDFFLRSASTFRHLISPILRSARSIAGYAIYGLSDLWCIAIRAMFLLFRKEMNHGVSNPCGRLWGGAVPGRPDHRYQLAA